MFSNIPKISIITPSYNQGSFLEETILSVLNQTYQNIEYIVIDGGSSDDSVEILKKYNSQISYWISEKDCGQADAINKGLHIATGEYVGWLNSDDCLLPDATKTVVDIFLKKTNVDFIYGDVNQGVCLTDSKKLQGKQTTIENMLISGQVPIPQQGSLWRRSSLEKIGQVCTKWHVVLDRDIFIRTALKCNIYYLHKTLGFFRQHPNSKSTSQAIKWVDELQSMYEIFFARKDLPNNIKNLKKIATAKILLTCSSLSIQSGNYLESFKFLAQSIFISPTILFSTLTINKIINRLKNLSKNKGL
jgi:glycosyltransferase involved in cell wall biosynthesis